MNRLKGAIRDNTNSKKKNNKNKNSKARAKIFGDYRFDWLRTCRHDYKSKNSNPERCVICMIGRKYSEKYLQEEKRIKANNRREAVLKRAELRQELLTGWSLNQGCTYQDTSISGPQSCEIILSGLSALSILRITETCGLDLDYFRKLVELRARILQVGNEAATFIQCRVRKYFVQKRIRRYLLNRFVWDPATRRRPQDSWIDKQTSKRFYDTPALLRDERPATPRTMQRRLKAEQKKIEEKDKIFRDFMNREEKERKHDVFHAYQRNIDDMKQLLMIGDLFDLSSKILYDSKSLIKIRTQEELDEENAAHGNYNTTSTMDFGFEEPAKTSDEDGNINEDSEEGRERKKLEEKNKKVAEANVEKPDFFISLGAPYPPLRTIGLSLACDTEPLMPYDKDRGNGDMVRIIPNTTNNNNTNTNTNTETDNESVDTTNGSNSSNSSNSPTKKKKKKKKQPKVSLNDRLKILERRRWESLRCKTGLDALKILLCDDNYPTLCSTLHIASDEYGIWKSEFDPPGRNPWDDMLGDDVVSSDSDDDQYDENGQVINEINDHNSVLTVDTVDSEDQDEFLLRREAEKCPVLPTFIKVNRYPSIDSNRHANGHFRLFFLENELIAVTQASEWTFYDEIYQNRDEIVSKCREFAQSNSIQTLVSQLLEDRKKRLDHYTLATNKALDRGYDHPIRLGEHMLKQPNKGVVTLYASPAVELYGHQATLHPNEPLSSEEVIHAAERYSFITKLSSFYEKLKSAIKDTKKKKKKTISKAADFSDFSFDDNVGNITVKGGVKVREKYRGTVPSLPMLPASELMGLDYFKKLLIDVPGGKEAILKLRNKLVEGLHHNCQSRGEIDDTDWGLTPLPPDVDKSDVEMHTRVIPDVIYREALGQLTSLLNASYFTRINSESLEVMLSCLSDEARKQRPLPRIYDVVALDVTINLPESPPTASNTNSNNGNSNGNVTPSRSKLNSTSSSLSSRGGGTSDKVDKTSDSSFITIEKKEPLTVKLLDVAGVFCSQNKEPPPALDLGLVNWSELHRTPEEAHTIRGTGLFVPSPNQVNHMNDTGKHPILGSSNDSFNGIGSSSSSSSSSNKAASGYVAAMGTWSTPIMPPDPKDNKSFLSGSPTRSVSPTMTTTSSPSKLSSEEIEEQLGNGVSTYREMLPNGRYFTCAVVAAPITQTWADKNIPKKYLKWLGVFKEPKSEYHK